jgi:hypothetical protein
MDVPHAGIDVMWCTLQVLMLKPCCSVVSPVTVKCSEIPTILPVSDNSLSEICKFSLSCRSLVHGHKCNVHCVMDQKGSHCHLASTLFKSVMCSWFPKDFLTKIHYCVVLSIQTPYPAWHSFPDFIVVMKLCALYKSFISISCNKFPVYASAHRCTRGVEILAPLFLHMIAW